MALIGSLVVTVTARTDDFENKLKTTRTTLKLTQDQAAEVAKGLGALGAALTQSGTQASTSARGFDQAATSLRSVKQASAEAAGGLSSAASGIKALAGSFAGLAVAAVSFQAIKSGVEGLLDSATKSQSLSAAFTAIAGSAQEGEKQLAFVRGTADKLGFSFTALAGSYKGLSAATRGTNLEGAATQQIFTAVATASRTLQLSTQDTQGVLLALQQIISKGTVQAEELRGQIGERLPGAFGIAARAMGVTEKELTKLLETGAVASNVFIPKFAAQLQKEFAGGAEAASKTFAAASERLGNAFARIGEAVAQSGVLDQLAKIVDKLAAIIAHGPKAADALRKVAETQTAKDREALAPFGGLPSADQAALDALSVRRARLRADVEKLAADTDFTSRYPGNLALERLRKNLAAVEAEYDALYARLKTKQQETFGTQEEGLGSIPTSRYVQAQDLLRKTLPKQAEELRKTLADLDKKSELSPGSAVEIVEEKIKALDKAIKMLQDTLAHNADLLPLLQGTGATALKGANAAGLAAALPLIQTQAAGYGLDPSLVTALIMQESGFNPRAVSPKGAAGLGQLMPGTAAGLGVNDPFDIQQNLTGTFKYLQQLTAQFKGNVELILAAYNAGPGAVTKYGGIPPFKETQAYVPGVLARQQAIQGAGGLANPVADLNALLQQKKDLEADLKGTREFEKDIIAQRQARWKDLDIFGLTLSPEQEADLKEMAKAQRECILAFAEDLDIFGLNLDPEQEKQRKALEKSIEALRAYQEQLELSGGALDTFGRLQKVTSEARAVTQAESRLANLPPELQVQGAQVIDRYRQLAKEAEPQFKQLTRLADNFAESFLSTMERATQGGIKSFKEFALSVAQDLMRLASQEYLRAALSGLIRSGLSAVAGLFTPNAGPGASSSLAQANAAQDYAMTEGRASGGPIMPGNFYRVGERGPETIYAASPGTVVPNGGQGLPPMVVNIYGVQDAAGLARSRGEIQRQMLNALTQAQRAA